MCVLCKTGHAPFQGPVADPVPVADPAEPVAGTSYFQAQAVV